VTFSATRKRVWANRNRVVDDGRHLAGPSYTPSPIDDGKLAAQLTRTFGAQVAADAARITLEKALKLHLDGTPMSDDSRYRYAVAVARNICAQRAARSGQIKI
jgi:hypothetical protein